MGIKHCIVGNGHSNQFTLNQHIKKKEGGAMRVTNSKPRLP